MNLEKIVKDTELKIMKKRGDIDAQVNASCKDTIGYVLILDQIIKEMVEDGTLTPAQLVPLKENLEKYTKNISQKQEKLTYEKHTKADEFVRQCIKECKDYENKEIFEKDIEKAKNLTNRLFDLSEERDIDLENMIMVNVGTNTEHNATDVINLFKDVGLTLRQRIKLLERLVNTIEKLQRKKD